MSFDSGRKLAIIASALTVIMPFATVLVGIFMFVSIAAIIERWIDGVSHTLDLYFGGFIILAIVVAIMGIVGFILFIVSMYRLSHYYNEVGIFKNISYVLISTIIAGIVVPVILYATPITLGVSFYAPANSQFINTILALVGMAYGFGIVNGVFYYRAFNMLAKKSGVGSFNTAGLLQLIGFLLSVILVGALLVWIAWMLAAIAFYSLKPAPSTNTYSTLSAGTSPNLAQTVRCPYCGTKNVPDALYCRSCGKQFQ
jgi:uncharacterized membrane protein